MEQQIKLKDVIHFYLGCDFITANSQGNLNPTTLREILKYWDHYKNPQLLLRRLESMTKEEAVGLLQVLFSAAPDPIDADEIIFDLVKGDGGLMVDADIDLVIDFSCRCFEGQLAIQNCGDMYLYDDAGDIQRLQFQSRAFNYLRKHGFDVDGLLDAGLAIEKK